MTEYFLGLIVFAFVGSVILSLVPAGTSKRYVRLLCGLCSVGCIVFPIFELASGNSGDISDLVEIFEPYDEYDKASVEIYNSALNRATLNNAEEALKNDIIKELSAKYGDIDVKIDIKENNDGFYIDKVLVFIHPAGYSLDPDRIAEVCRKRLGKKCDIIYK